MKNVVLIDFSPESMKALDYAIEMVSKIEDASLELLNVSSSVGNVFGNEDLENTIFDGLVINHLDEIFSSLPEGNSIELEKLNALKEKYNTTRLKLEVKELTGSLLDTLPDYLNEEKIGFVFGGTHDLNLLDRIFSSRTFKLMKEAHVNFVFVPESVKKVNPVKKVLVPILSDKHSLQNLEPLIFLWHFMKFDITLCTYDKNHDGQDQILYMGMKILKKAGIPYKTKYIGSSEKELLDRLIDMAHSLEIDMVSIVDFTEENIFNFGKRGFVENSIRNERGITILAIQNRQLTKYSGFHTAGGY